MTAKMGSAATELDDSKYNIRAIERAVEVFNVFAREKKRLSLNDLTKLTGLSKPTVFRILSTLHSLGYVSIDGDGRYRLGSVFLTLASTVGSQEMQTAVRPHSESLRNDLGATVLVGALADDHLIYIDKKESQGPVRISTGLGWRRDPPTFGMLGMALMAHLGDAEANRILDAHPLMKHTAKSIVDRAAFSKRLEEIRAKGFVFEEEEAIEGVWGVASPVQDSFGEVVAAIGVALPTSLKSKEKVKEVTARVIKAAEDISRDLGFRG